MYLCVGGRETLREGDKEQGARKEREGGKKGRVSGANGRGMTGR